MTVTWHRGGDGPPLILIHGISDTRATWDAVLPALEREHDVMAVNLLGHHGGAPMPAGEEPTPAALADQVERDMDACGMTKAHLVGNSLGAWLALELAARGRGLSVVSFAPTGGWEVGNAALARTRRVFRQAELMAKVTAPAAPLLMRLAPLRWIGLRELVARPLKVPPATAATMVRGAAGCAIFRAHLDLTSRTGFPPLGPIDVPVKIVWGAQDRILPPQDTAAGIRRMVPDATWVELPGVGHLPQIEVPERTAREILSWTGAAAPA